ncbi:sensor histidine kinase [Rosettibacter firmus]|uniref:sensor histidine kinase n=1 Tax=Rosettibacter firmus TaxID=3111522 RepID=UPI00336BDF54
MNYNSTNKKANSNKTFASSFFITKKNIKLLIHAINSVHECISITDLNHNIIFVNQTFLNTYGYTLDEIIGKNTSILRSPKNDPEILKRIHEETQKGGWNGRLINVKKDGSEFIIELSTSIVKDEKGEPIAYVGLSKDISDLVQTEEKLIEAEKKYHELFMELKDVVYESTIDGKFIELNPSGMEFFGINSIDELNNINIVNDIYLNPDDRERFKNELIKNGFVKDFEIDIKKLNGEIVTVRETSVAVKDKNGKIIGYRGILRDVTERKKHEAQLKELVKELEILNQELKNSNASKDKFFSIIAHDLRSPFSSLLSFSEFLYQDIDELSKDEIKSFAQNINDAAKTVFNLLENLLQWSRIQTGTISFKPRKFNIYDVSTKVINLLLNNALIKKIELINNINKDEIVFADEDMIFSVIQNLLSNAIKFTYENGKIILSSKEKDNMVEISISDNGIGMDDKDIEKLFRIDIPFTKSGTRDEKGSGLGLILCKEMIEKNKGKIWVSSKLNEGTTFTFTLHKNEFPIT